MIAASVTLDSRWVVVENSFYNHGQVGGGWEAQVAQWFVDYGLAAKGRSR